MKRLGVLGWPVRHSRSPAMHNAALRAAGLTGWDYQHLPVPPDLFAETVRALPGAGFVGANVTIPHKEAALALADDATDEARAIGAANTLTFRADGSIHAANTDAPAIAALAGDARSVMLLGAGGSAKAVAYALRGAHISVWNRTPERAISLGEVVDRPVPADLLVNCTSVGLTNPSTTFKDLPLSADALHAYVTVVDLVYRQDGDTALIAEARRQGCAVVDGLEILVRQGALSFEAWTGQEAPLDAMREGARGGPQHPDLDPPGSSPPALRRRSIRA